MGQGKFAGQRPAFYHCATQGLLLLRSGWYTTVSLSGWVVSFGTAAGYRPDMTVVWVNPRVGLGWIESQGHAYSAVESTLRRLSTLTRTFSASDTSYLLVCYLGGEEAGELQAAPSRLPLFSARPAVTFPAAEHLAATKLYCLQIGVNNLPKVVTQLLPE